MQINRSFGVPKALFAALLTASALLPACTPQVSVAPRVALEPERSKVTVNGQGQIKVKPDIARASVGVEVFAPTVAEASKMANARMAEIAAALAKVGIADKDIRTINYSVSLDRPNQPPPPPVPLPVESPAPAPKKGTKLPPPSPAPSAAPPPMYRLNNMLEITIHDVGRVGPVLDAALGAGANHVWGVNFEVDKTEVYEAQALAKAVENARTQAEALAKLSGATLGEVISIMSEPGGMPWPGPMPMAKFAEASDGMGQTTWMSPGEITYGKNVQVIFALKGKEAEATAAPAPSP